MKNIIDYINETQIDDEIYFLSYNNKYKQNELKNIFKSKFDIDYNKYKKYLTKFISKELNYSVNAVEFEFMGDYFYISFGEFDEEFHNAISIKTEYDKKFNVFIYRETNDKYNIYKKLNEYNSKINYDKFIKDLKKFGYNLKSNKVDINYYVDKKVKETQTLTGTISDIFNEFTTLTDRKTYSSNYYKFVDENLEYIYLFYIKYIDKDHLLKNLLKRNVTID